MASRETLSPSKTSEMETFQTQEVREPVKPSRVGGEVVVREFLISTLTETLPVLSPGMVSVVLGESWNTEKEYNRPLVLHPISASPPKSPPLAAAYAIPDFPAATSTQAQSSFTCSQVTQQRAATTTSQFSPQLPTSQFPSLANKTQIPSLVTDYWGSGI